MRDFVRASVTHDQCKTLCEQVWPTITGRLCASECGPYHGEALCERVWPMIIVFSKSATEMIVGKHFLFAHGKLKFIL